jgi:hypothetical protein
MQNILGDIKFEEDFRTLSAQYQGETEARSLEDQARMLRAQASGYEFSAGQSIDAGRRAKQQSQTAQLGTLAKFGSSLYGKYGQGGPDGGEGDDLYGAAEPYDVWETGGYRGY